MDLGSGPGAGDRVRVLQPRRHPLSRLLSRFRLAQSGRSSPGDLQSRPPPRSGHCDGDGEGSLACSRGSVPATPGISGDELPPNPQSQKSQSNEGRPPGAQGLKNLGNTCFMNAVVQCLSNTDLLAEFLALGRYSVAPGLAEVTEQLAALVRALWTREYRPQLSAEFKK